jgi:anti-anti-sigma regulatory factor
MVLKIAAGQLGPSTPPVPPFRGLSVAVRPTPPANAGVVEVRGEVDSTSAGLLADRIAHARFWFDSVVVDLSGVTFFSAAGVHALRTGTPLRLVCSPAVLKVLTTCGLDDDWELHRSAFLALAAGVSMDFSATSAIPERALRAAGDHRG